MEDLLNITLITKKRGVIISFNEYKEGDKIGNMKVIKTHKRKLYREGWKLNPIPFGFNTLNDLVRYYSDQAKEIFTRELNFIVLRVA